LWKKYSVGSFLTINYIENYEGQCNYVENVKLGLGIYLKILSLSKTKAFDLLKLMSERKSTFND